MIYVLDVNGIELAIEASTYQQAGQIAVELVSSPEAVWFRGAYETWDAAKVVHPHVALTVRPEAMSPSEMVEVERYFDWPLANEELREHIKQFQEGTGIYASGLPKVLHFKEPCICERYAGVRGSAEWLCPTHGKCSTGSFDGRLKP